VENFIRELENGVRQMDVKGIKINRGSERAGQLMAEIKLVTYLFKKQAE